MIVVVLLVSVSVILMFNQRAEGHVDSACSWKSIRSLLRQKVMRVKTICVDQFRPIAIIPWTLKLYMCCLLSLVRHYIEPKGFIQYGNRKHHQAAELIQILRLVIEKTAEWGLGLVIVSLDMKKAFDTKYPDAIEQLLVECDVPMKLLLAIVQEILDDRTSFP